MTACQHFEIVQKGNENARQNCKSVDKLLDQSMKRELFETVNVGGARYYFIDQYDDVGGEPVIVREVGGASRSWLTTCQKMSCSGANHFAGLRGTALRASAVQPEEADDLAGGAGILTQSQLNKTFREQEGRRADAPPPPNDVFLRWNTAEGTNRDG